MLNEKERKALARMMENQFNKAWDKDAKLWEGKESPCWHSENEEARHLISLEHVVENLGYAWKRDLNEKTHEAHYYIWHEWDLK